MLRPRPAILVAIAILVAACGASGPTSTPGNTATASGTASAAPATTAPGDSPSVGPGESQPAESATPEVSASASPEPSASTASTAADACTGSQANREFFVNVTAAVAWPVLCATLPKGWFVSAGSYRLANGGKLLVSYKGPGGATLALSEGAFCLDAGGCVSPGTDAGDAAFGPRTGTFVRLVDGGFAIIVDRGATLSWMLEAHGLDEATAKALGAALVEVVR